jgi:hypothetical protein
MELSDGIHLNNRCRAELASNATMSIQFYSAGIKYAKLKKKECCTIIMFNNKTNQNEIKIRTGS